MLGIQKCLRQRFQGLQSTGKGRRRCFEADRYGRKRSDPEREQCDTWNLGCLVRCFPDLGNPPDKDRHHNVTIMAMIKKVDVMDGFLNGSGYILLDNFIESHIQGTSCGILPSVMRGCMARVKGLKLEI